MRLFIAAKPDENSIDALQDLQEQLCQAGLQARAVDAANLHMTLAFLGEVADPKTVKTITDRLRNSRFPELAMKAEGLESWRGVVVLKLAPDAAIEDYVSKLRAFLLQEEIRFDPKPYRPHITLFRKAGVFAGLKEMAAGMEIRFSFAALYESKTENGKLVYTKIS